MKHLILLCLSFFILSSADAQNGPVDFETPGNGADWTWTVFENEVNPPLEIITNPDQSAANGSATVAQFTALQAGEAFAGCETMHGADIGTFTINEDNKIIKIMVWKSVISDVGMKLVRSDSWALPEIKVPNTLVNEWEEITFDFTGHIGNEYDQIVIFPDFDARTEDRIIYFDNINFGTAVPLDEPMTAAPDPTIEAANVISMFSNVYTDVAVDTWQTDWSQGTLSDIQIAGNDTKKYSNLNFVGIETTGANLIDASSMMYFNVDVWTPNLTQFRIKLVDFGADGAFEGGDDTEHEVIFENPNQSAWVSYQIPLSDFTGLANRDNIAQLIFSGNPPGSGVVYMDNVYFSTISTGVQELAAEDFRIFPNPVSGQLNVTFNDVTSGTITIMDTAGKTVQTTAIVSTQTSLDISHLPTGFYLIELDTDKGATTQKLMKQ